LVVRDPACVGVAERREAPAALPVGVAGRGVLGGVGAASEVGGAAARRRGAQQQGVVAVALALFAERARAVVVGCCLARLGLLAVPVFVVVVVVQHTEQPSVERAAVREVASDGAPE
jgi:hypothetical protein